MRDGEFLRRPWNVERVKLVAGVDAVVVLVSIRFVSMWFAVEKRLNTACLVFERLFRVFGLKDICRQC